MNEMETMNEIAKRVEDQRYFVRRVHGVTDWFCVVSPLLDSNNDHLQFYVRRLDNGEYRISDDGSALDDLACRGGQWLRETIALDDLGVRIEDDELTTTATEENLLERIRAMEVAYLIVVRR